jgi:hypothetical protein
MLSRALHMCNRSPEGCPEGQLQRYDLIRISNLEIPRIESQSDEEGEGCYKYCG